MGVWHVGSLGKTGSGWHKIKPMRLTLFGNRVADDGRNTRYGIYTENSSSTKLQAFAVLVTFAAQNLDCLMVVRSGVGCE